MKRTFYLFCLICTLCLITLPAYSQILPPDGPPENPDQQPVPLTGIELLIGAGAAFGAKKLIDARRRS